MAYQAPPAVCSLPAYQTFMPLSGFPSALGYCSTTSLSNKRAEQITPSLYTLRDVQCPVGDSYLCDLLAELKASEHEFARGVWYVSSDVPEGCVLTRLLAAVLGSVLGHNQRYCSSLEDFLLQD